MILKYKFLKKPFVSNARTFTFAMHVQLFFGNLLSMLERRHNSLWFHFCEFLKLQQSTPLQNEYMEQEFGHYRNVSCMILTFMVLHIFLQSRFHLSFKITSYILLRNLPSYLRVRFSSLFSWIGSMSVEVRIHGHHSFVFF